MWWLAACPLSLMILGYVVLICILSVLDADRNALCSCVCTHWLTCDCPGPIFLIIVYINSQCDWFECTVPPRMKFLVFISYSCTGTVFINWQCIDMHWCMSCYLANCRAYGWQGAICVIQNTTGFPAVKQGQCLLKESIYLKKYYGHCISIECVYIHSAAKQWQC